MMQKRQIDRLISAAIKARDQAYAPYSKFKVGAALLGDDNRIFTGCNVENASYGATVCAERTAVCKAVSEGCRSFVAIAIVYDRESLADPCGMCRQVLHEFGDTIVVIRANLQHQYDVTTVGDLLPGAFHLPR